MPKIKLPTEYGTKLLYKPSVFGVTYLLLLGFFVGCSGGSNTNVDEPAPPVATTPAPAPAPPISNVAIPDNRFSSSYSILIFGNSHIAGIGDLLQQILLTDDNSIEVHIDSFGGGFLDSSTYNPQRMDRLKSRDWSHVILQGQKYSQSGIISYPTTATENWIRVAKDQNITPVLFPEHPRRNNPHEGQQIHNLHTSISAAQLSCVAPVGLAWDKVLALRPELNMYLMDGNHASSMGKVLSAMVFYEVITGYPANLLPYIPQIDVAADVQSLFAQVASETIAQHTPCIY